MKSSAQLFVVLLVVMLVASEVSTAPAPRWKGWKKIERAGQRVRNAIIKAGPAVGVLASAKALG